MKPSSILLASSIMLAMLQPASAQVSLKLSDDVELLTLNGQKASTNSALNLPNGINQIAFRYNAQYRQQASTVRYQSQIVIVRFEAADQQLSLNLPTIDSNKTAKAFDVSPQLQLIDQNNIAIAFSYDSLVKNGLQIGRDFEQEVLQYNLANKIASIAVPQQAALNLSGTTSSSNTASPITTAPANTSVAVSKATDGPTQAEINHMLDYWYQQADEATKAKFKAKINQQ